MRCLLLAMQNSKKNVLGKMGEVSKGQGRTVLFVSHNMGAVRGLCNKAVLMQHGKIEQRGDVGNVIAQYLVNPSAVLMIFSTIQTIVYLFKVSAIKIQKGRTRKTIGWARTLL